MVIDWTISVGTLIQLAGILVVGVAAFYALRADIRILRHDMKNVQLRQEALADTMANISTTLTTVAVQGARLDRAEETIKELRHGQGFVSPMRS